MRKRIATALVAASLYAGCGGENPNTQGETPPKPVPTINVPHDRHPLTPEMRARMRTDGLFASLINFRERILVRRSARVLMGACVAWPNASGGITATINPGEVSYTDEGGDKVSYNAFSVLLDPQDPSTLTQLNGPELVKRKDGSLDGYDNVALEFFRKNGRVKLEVRPLSDQPTEDSQGRVYFRDRETGEPIMLTGLAPYAEFTETNIRAACDDLLHHQPLPGESSA